MKNRLIIIFLTAIYIFSAHFILPVINDGEDFFIFSTWSLFAQPLETEFYDISWNDGASFAFRDHIQEMKAANLPVHELFHLLSNKKHNIVRDHFLVLLKKYADCENLKIYKFRGILHQHILLKIKLPALEVMDLCVQ